MVPLKGSVSWTGKPVSYYLHVIDRTKVSFDDLVDWALIVARNLLFLLSNAVHLNFLCRLDISFDFQ